MATDRAAVPAIAAAAALLLWPALWNGYPIVFADTGTYLSQAVHRYAGWDRPVFYSLFMLPLHATVTLWPVLIVQALIAAWVLRLVCRALRPDFSDIWFVFGVAALSACSWLPWLVCELMPDLFTPLLVLVLVLLGWVPDGLGRWERISLVGLATLMIACQQSSIPLACVLAVVLCLCSGLVGQRPLRRGLTLALPPALALVALCAVNLAAHGRFAVSPFGNVFLLARVIYDGPGLTVLRRDCPQAGWRLCPFVERLPATSDEFLWAPGSPLELASGAKVVSREAGAIIQAALIADPTGAIGGAIGNTLEQLGRFASGDGLNPWPAQVSPWIARDFPAREFATYNAARQQTDSLTVPLWLQAVHQAAALAGVIGCVLLLPVAWVRRAPAFGFLLAVLLAIPVSAAITGALSAPHDRYQSRIMWLAPFVGVLTLVSPRRRTGSPSPRDST